MDVAVHPELGLLVRLIGKWVGQGEGRYPTIEPFRYREEVQFAHNGKPFVSYRQATVNLATGQPAHAEAGYLRAVAPGRVELVLAHPTGIVEVSEGEVLDEPNGLALHVMSNTVLATPTAKEVATVERRISLAGEVLRYQVAMAAVGQPLQHHLAAELRRTG